MSNECVARFFSSLSTHYSSLSLALVSRSALPQRKSCRTFDPDCVKLPVLAVRERRVKPNDIGRRYFFGDGAEEWPEVGLARVDAAAAGLIDQAAHIQRNR